jgi:hypothetical protein
VRASSAPEYVRHAPAPRYASSVGSWVHWTPAKVGGFCYIAFRLFRPTRWK